MAQRDPDASTDRIERKRAHDREAQRQSRAKTKAYIAHLEKTVEDLTKNNGNKHSEYLQDHASKQARAIESLNGLVSKIQSIIQEAGRCDPSVLLPLPPVLAPEGEGSVTFGTPGAYSEADSDGRAGPGSTGRQPSRQYEWATDVAKATDPNNPIGRAIATCATKLTAELGGSLVCDPKDPHYFMKLNDAIARVEQTARDDLTTREDDEDILIRAIVHGWDAVEKKHYLDLVWRLFRHADETLWYRIRPIDRLAHFWQMRSTMLNKIRPKGQKLRTTPAFMTSTALQVADPSHPPIADYFAWPNVRDSLISSGIANVSGKEAISFADSFRFMWRYDMRDAYMKDIETDKYSFSEAFLRSFNNLSSYKILQEQESTAIPGYINPQVPIRDEDRVQECDDGTTPGSEEYNQGNVPVEHVPADGGGVMLAQMPAQMPMPHMLNNPMHDPWLPAYEPVMLNDPDALWQNMYQIPMPHASNTANWPEEF